MMKHLKRIKITKKGIKYYYNRKQAIYIDRLILFITLITCILGFAIKGVYCTIKHNYIQEEAYEEVKEEREVFSDAVATDVQVTTEQKEETTIQERGKEYRMTYYHPGDSTNSGNTTASGLGTNAFKLNNRGWYTYKGKLVVATAHESLKSWDRYKDSTQETYELYDELTLIIEGTEYEAIVLDKCGACMKAEKIDLYVKDGKSGLDTNIEVIRK